MVHSWTIFKQKEAKQAEGAGEHRNWDGFVWKILTDAGEQLALRQGWEQNYFAVMIGLLIWAAAYQNEQKDHSLF